MKLLAQKSLKMELRLKRYEVLKLQGLHCNLQIIQGPRCKSFRIKQNNGLFYKAKTCGPRAVAVHGRLMT
jgi:hypothetical protein